MGSEELLPVVDLRNEEAKMAKIGEKEQARREMRVGKATAAAKPPAERPEASPPAKQEAEKAEPKESTVRSKKAKKTPPRAAVKGKTSAKKSAKSERSPQAVGEFVCRAGGCTMDELVKKFGVEAHPMRAKIHAAKHQLGFKIEYDHEAKRYAGTAP